jgi:hypothetical protein
LQLTIDERAIQLGTEKIGQRLTPDVSLAPGVKVAGFYNAVLLDVRGEVYVLAEATVADKFR